MRHRQYSAGSARGNKLVRERGLKGTAYRPVGDTRTLPEKTTEELRVIIADPATSRMFREWAAIILKARGVEP